MSNNTNEMPVQQVDQVALTEQLRVWNENMAMTNTQCPVVGHCRNCGLMLTQKDVAPMFDTSAQQGSYPMARETWQGERWNTSQTNPSMLQAPVQQATYPMARENWQNYNWNTSQANPPTLSPSQPVVLSSMIMDEPNEVFQQRAAADTKVGAVGAAKTTSDKSKEDSTTTKKPMPTKKKTKNSAPNFSSRALFSAILLIAGLV